MATELVQETGIIFRFITSTLPAVGKELKYWEEQANTLLGEQLRHQAISSIHHKRFHAQGGSVYMLLAPGHGPGIVRFIVALQTISDYLDNLCDRVGYVQERGFWHLHQAMIDACEPDGISTNYYAHYPFQSDRGYLSGLVLACNQQLSQFPSYGNLRREVVGLISLYCHLQTYKHLPNNIREQRLKEWIKPHLQNYSDLYWWEFAAATGSTLGVFTLCAAATSALTTQKHSTTLLNAYFPWICGLHILLDYLIDLGEDDQEGDLNFVSYYHNIGERNQRLHIFTQKALEAVESLPDAPFHRAVVRGLLALYLSDPKVEREGLGPLASQLLHLGGRPAINYHKACLLLRRLGVI